MTLCCEKTSKKSSAYLDEKITSLIYNLKIRFQSVHIKFVLKTENENEANKFSTEARKPNAQKNARKFPKKIEYVRKATKIL